MRFIKWLKKVFNPPYQLIFIEKDKAHGERHDVYIFKQYGTPDFLSLTYNDIVKNANLLRAIHPLTLMEISEIECVKKINENSCSITKVLKNNEFEINNKCGVKVYSGEYICNNMDIFHDMNAFDLCLIAYETGFINGRRLSKELAIAKKKIDGNSELSYNNVVRFKDY
ncbi:hypothetical protein [Serratia fonticola]|uniref:hypothetical protein n=1 Tax=Serratia fonticola TaxID=47917 RepID=UPI00301C10DE